MNRRGFMRTMGAGAAALAAARTARGARAQEGLRLGGNVILYVSDDQGRNDAGCFGNTVVRTPGLDMLAAGGVRFSRAFCTTPSCSPSRSVILTGLHNHATGQYGLQHADHHFQCFDNVRGLPVLLGDAGYRTAIAGKFHVGPEPSFHFQRTIGHGAPSEMAESCRGIFEEKSDTPFFLYFCPTEPHRPFKREGSAPVDPAAVRVPEYLPDTPECRAELAAYYGSIERCDSGLLRLIELLKETGRWEETMIIYVSDNGAPFPGAKTDLYEPGVNLPCVVRHPDATARGVVCDGLVTWADITPTILDYAGVEPPKKGFHGASFLPSILSGEAGARGEVFLSHTFHEVTMYYPMRCVRGMRHKLIWNIAHQLPHPFASDIWGSDTWQAFLKSGAEVYGRRRVDAFLHRPEYELYDLETDPDECVNLAEAPEHRELLDAMKAKLRRFQEETKDPWVVKWEHE